MEDKPKNYSVDNLIPEDVSKGYSIDDANSKIIIDMALAFLDSDLSLRKFAEKYCEFSHVTLREKFIRDLGYYNGPLCEAVKEKLDNRKGKNINIDKEAQERVWRAITMLLQYDMTISDIASIEHTSEMVIYRDLTSRLQQMNEVSIDIKRDVLERLKKHSLDNLINQGNSRQ